jgi:hypothetical protein
LHHSHFQPDLDRVGEWIACLWQGAVPADLVVRQWLYLPGAPRGMIMLWEGEAAGEAYVERAFGPFGALDTQVVSDATLGLAAAINRDLAGFERWLRDRGASAQEVARQVDLRARGKAAPTQAAAAAEGRAWTAEA